METSEDVRNEMGLYVSHMMLKCSPTYQGRLKVTEGLAQIKEEAPLKGTQVFFAATFGHESDVIAMVLAETTDEILRIEQLIKSLEVEIVDSFLSLTETSEYTTTEPEEQARVDGLTETVEEKSKMMDAWRERMAIYEKHKLFPELPPKNMEYICFYPMSKKREGDNNWFSLPFEKRAEYMRAHGTVGRKYSGRITQLITGSTGLTDWEWGVSLFSKTLSDIKDIVYEMRFDEASALYGEFGHFTIGRICEPDQIFAN